MNIAAGGATGPESSEPRSVPWRDIVAPLDKPRQRSDAPQCVHGDGDGAQPRFNPGSVRQCSAASKKTTPLHFGSRPHSLVALVLSASGLVSRSETSPTQMPTATGRVGCRWIPSRIWSSTSSSAWPSTVRGASVEARVRAQKDR